jgi:hypothetical protein
MHWDHVDVIGLIDLQVVPGQKESALGLFPGRVDYGKGGISNGLQMEIRARGIRAIPPSVL